MGGLSVDINSNDSIFTGDQSVEKGDFKILRSWCFIEETGRAFNTRKKEHLGNTKIAVKGSKIANHAWSNNHAIDFDNALIIDKGTFRTRKTLEAWHTRVTPNTDNNSCLLSAHYQ